MLSHDFASYLHSSHESAWSLGQSYRLNSLDHEMLANLPLPTTNWTLAMNRSPELLCNSPVICN
jgi:hypothetical protein